MFGRLRQRASKVYSGAGPSSTIPVSVDVQVPVPVPVPDDVVNSNKNVPPSGDDDDKGADVSTTTADSNNNSANASTNTSEIQNITESENSTVNTHKIFSIMRTSATQKIAKVINTESKDLKKNMADEGDTGATSRIPVTSSSVEDATTIEPSNPVNVSTKENPEKSRTELGKLFFSKMRLSASKAYEASTTKKMDVSIPSTGSHHSITLTTERVSLTSSAADTQTLKGNEETDVVSEEILNDPEIGRLLEQIQLVQYDLDAIKESGKHSQKWRQQEYGKCKQNLQSKSRELWFATQKMRRFNGLGDYKTELMRCSLPAHDTSAPTLTLEAKLLRAQHQGAILDHQLAIVHVFQQHMIDYLYTTALPDVKAEQELATMVGKSQLNKMIKAKETMVQLFEDCLGLQRKIIAKYRLRELEHSRLIDSDGAKQEVELLKVMTGEIPAMERNAELRDSAKRRLEERLQVKDRQLERRRSREQDLIKTTKRIVDDDKAILEKANEQVVNISNHSVQLLLQIRDDDNGGDKDDDRGDNGDANKSQSTKYYRPLEDANQDGVMVSSHSSFGEFGDEVDTENEMKRKGTSDQNGCSTFIASPTQPVTPATPHGKSESGNTTEQSVEDHFDDSTSEIKDKSSGHRRVSSATVARLRARRLPRDPDASERSVTSTSNHGDSEHGTSEHSNSEGGEDTLEPGSPRANRRVGLLSNQRYSNQGSTVARSRTDLLERARSARLNTTTGTPVVPNYTATSMRPSLGHKAMSSRDFSSRRPTIHSNKAQLGGSEHREPLLVSSDVTSRTRPGLAATAAAERQARLERLASRRRLTETSSGQQLGADNNRPLISAERRAQLRAGLNHHKPEKQETSTNEISHDGEGGGMM